jgi:hypothetical protein
MKNLNSVHLLLLQQLGIKPLQPNSAFFVVPQQPLPTACLRLHGQLLADVETCVTLTSLQGYCLHAEPQGFSVQQQHLYLDPQLQFTPTEKRALWQLLGEYIND